MPVRFIKELVESTSNYRCIGSFTTDLGWRGS